MKRIAFVAAGLAAASVPAFGAGLPEALANGEPLGKGKMLVLEDAGAQGRVVVWDSTAYLKDRDVLPSDVVIVASYAGTNTLRSLFSQGAKGAIADDAGIGKDNAAINGLFSAEKLGLPVAAVATLTAEMSNGRSLALGTISRVNGPARALGVKPGQTAYAAAHLLLAAPAGTIVRLDPEAPPQVLTVDETPAGKIYADTSSFDLFAKLGKCPHDVVCIGANSARVFGESILEIMPRGAIGNDCGIGKNQSAIAGLPMLEQAGVAAAAVAAMSARIGDGMSTWRDGVISAVNAVAKSRGVTAGMTARQAARMML
jgi:hypothetical protein